MNKCKMNVYLNDDHVLTLHGYTGEIAEELAEREWNNNGNDADFRRDWEFGHAMHETVYAEESY